MPGAFGRGRAPGPLAGAPLKASALRLPEFVTLLALLISLVALSIDAMLPALPMIGEDLGASGNQTQWVISAMFLGFACGQLVYGPLSDSLGRKRTIYAGIALFVFGCVLSILSTSFEVMLVGRVLQGLGAAASRTVTLALVRDQFSGPDMARVMSVIMSVFILVPAVAPALGQAILLVASWRMIFVALVAQALTGVFWFALRQPETLPPERRARLGARVVGRACLKVLRSRVAMGYTLVASLVSGAFVGYLISSQQIFVEVYGAGERFPLYFAGLALCVGAASVTNSRLVMRFGMERLTWLFLFVMCALSGVFGVVVYLNQGVPPLGALMAYMCPLFFCVGILFGNLNSMAMEPLGHVAGTASAVIGSISTFGSLILGTAVAQSFNGTVGPLVTGFFSMSAAALLVMAWTARARFPRRVQAASAVSQESRG